jgi:protein translocase SecG subunit
MYFIGIVVFVVVSFFLMLLILLRPSESGGGLGGAFGGGGGGDSPFGVRAVQTLDKVIAWTAGILLLLAVLMAWRNSH